MKYYHLYVKPVSEVTNLRLANGCLQQEKVTLSNPNKITQPGGEINADEGCFDEDESFISQHPNLWEE